MVENGNIDQAHHLGMAKRAFNETLSLESAVAAAVRMTDPADTLILVTADHAHTLNINGYPDRTLDITGANLEMRKFYSGRESNRDLPFLTRSRFEIFGCHISI